MSKTTTIAFLSVMMALLIVSSAYAAIGFIPQPRQRMTSTRVQAVVLNREGNLNTNAQYLTGLGVIRGATYYWCYGTGCVTQPTETRYHNTIIKR